MSPCLTRDVSFDCYRMKLVSTNDSGVSFLLLLALPPFQLFPIALGGADPFLNKPLIREDIRSCTEYFKNTAMEATHPHLWEAARAVLRGDSLLPGLTLRRERKRNNKSSPCLMNFVPFKLQTKRNEKKEVINLNKMEEERVDKLNQRHLEEMTFVQRGAVWDSYGEGRVLPFVYLGVDGFGDAISGAAVGPVATYRPGT